MSSHNIIHLKTCGAFRKLAGRGEILYASGPRRNPLRDALLCCANIPSDQNEQHLEAVQPHLLDRQAGDGEPVVVAQVDDQVCPGCR